MKKLKLLFIAVCLLSFNCFSQKHNTFKIKRALDSMTAANLIVGTWFDTKNPMHIFTLTTEFYPNQPDYRFSETGIRRVRYSNHWEYLTKDSGDTRFVDSTNIIDSVVTMDSIHGLYWVEQHPLGYYSQNDTEGTVVVLLLVYWGNGWDAKDNQRVLLLDDKALKVSLGHQNEIFLFKRKD